MLVPQLKTIIIMITEFGSELMSSKIQEETDGVGPSDKKIYSNALCNNNK